MSPWTLAYRIVMKPEPVSRQNGAKGERFWRRFLRNRSGLVGGMLALFLLSIAVLGALSLTPFPPTEQHRLDSLTPPNAQYPLGSDLFGRDIASRLMKGASNSLYVAIFSVSIATLVGAVIGTVAGFFGGTVDTLLMRCMDIFFAFPGLLLALLIITVLGRGLNNTLLAIGVVYTPIFARVARGPVLALKEREFVLAARVTGANPAHILRQHILPNMAAPLIVQVTLGLSWALLTESGLSFLGLGPPVGEPSWGGMLSGENRALAEKAPWLLIYPALAIMLGVLSFNLLGDGLRDVLDPKLRGRR